MKRRICAFAVLLALLFFSACAKQPAWHSYSEADWTAMPERVSENEVLQLQKVYPGKRPDSGSFYPLPPRSWFDFFAETNPVAVAVLKMNCDYSESKTHLHAANTEQYSMTGQFPLDVEHYSTAEVVKVLWGEPEFKAGEMISLMWMRQALLPLEVLKAFFMTEQEYVVMLRKSPTSELLMVDLQNCFYLTPEGAILKTAEVLEPSSDLFSAYTGMNLSAFMKLYAAEYENYIAQAQAS